MKAKAILLDPPWLFKVRSPKGEGRSAVRHYPTMTLDRIKKLPIKDIAHKDAALFLWGTCPMLPHVLATMTAWGFEYSTMPFVWIKLTKRAYANFVKWQKKGWTPEEILARLFANGTGYWTMANAEFVLLGRQKGGKPKRVKKGIRSLVVTPVREHSRKPDEVRERIVEMMGDILRIEVFARDTAPGWVSIGNEITGREIEDDIRLIAAR